MDLPPGLPSRRLLYAWLVTVIILLVAIVALQIFSLSYSDVQGRATGVPTADRKTVTRPATLAPTATLSFSPTATRLVAITLPLPTITPFIIPEPTQAPSATATATYIPRPTLTALPGCAVVGERHNLRAGPNASERAILRLEDGELLRPLASTDDGAWVQIMTFDGIEGWVVGTWLNCSPGILDALPVVSLPTRTPTPAPTPTFTPAPPTPTVVVITEWRGEYFRGTSLSESPLLTRNDFAVSFDWGEGSPHPLVPADNFSARWTRALRFDAGTYRFRLTVDDGARLYVDDRLVLDMWTGGAVRTQVADYNLSEGEHTLRVEYFEAQGLATVSLAWERVTTFVGWRGEYYGNAYLGGNPIVVRDDLFISFDWGEGSPDPRIPADDFSVRWTRDLDFAAGTYRFTLRADDGVRFWVNGVLIIDEWRDANATYEREINLGSGRHSLRLEYYERKFNAAVSLSWVRVENYPDWKGEYFNNDDLQGAPVVVRNDARIDFSWGTGSPAPEINADRFSVRWTGRPNLAAGNYVFRVVVDDGVRLWVNGALVLDMWSRPSTYVLVVNIPYSGSQDVRVEYREITGWAEIRLSIERSN